MYQSCPQNGAQRNAYSQVKRRINNRPVGQYPCSTLHSHQHLHSQSSDTGANERDRQQGRAIDNNPYYSNFDDTFDSATKTIVNLYRGQPSQGFKKTHNQATTL